MHNQLRYMILDGELQEWQHLMGAYIYQNIHTLEYKPRHTYRHVEILTSLADELFGIEFSATADTLSQQIVTLLEQTRATRQRSIRVVVKQYASGSMTVECDAPSLYRGYVVRSLRPDAVTMRMDMPLDIYPTSASVAAREVAESIVRSRDFHTAIMMSSDKQIYSEAAEPMAVVQGSKLILQSLPYSVESRLVQQAARKADIEVEVRGLNHDDIVQADEVLRIGWQGITAMQSVDGKLYMAIVADHLAREMEKIQKL